MRRNLVLTFSILILSVSCIPIAPTLPAQPTPLPTISPVPTTTPIPTITSTSTPLPTATPTPRPQTKLLEDTLLYIGPDNEDDVIAQLKAGSVVFPLATFGDFVKVEGADETGMQTGFIGKLTLDSLPVDLSELNMNEVPWRNVDVVSHFTLNPGGFYLPYLQDNTLVLDNTISEYSSNLSFPLLMVSAFRLTFQMETIDQKLGYITFQDKPNSMYGPYWQGVHRLDFNTRGGILDVGIADGRTENSRTGFPLVADGQTVLDSQTITITFLDPFGKVFVISDQNGQEILRTDVTQLSSLKLLNGLFPEGTVRIGYGIVAGAIIRLSSLSLQLAPSGIWNNTSALSDQPTLRHLAEQQGITIGTDFSWWNFMVDPSYWWSNTTDPNIWNILFDNFDSVTLPMISSTTFWSGIGEYDFTELDCLVDWAIRNNFRVRVPNLVSGRYDRIPNWLRYSNYTRDQYTQILEDNIKTVVGHYKGRVAEWSIAVDDQSPPMSRSYLPRGDFWDSKLGPDYIEMAFRWAKEADPNAILIFNTDNIESPRDKGTQTKIDNIVALLIDLKSNGVPVDVVGMQMHLLVPWNSSILPLKADVIQTMRRFADLGVAIYITEFDVNLQNIPGTQEKRWDSEAQVYRDMLEACLDSGVCKSFSTWGVSDSTSWETCSQWWCLNLPNADPLMFDRDLQPKPAYYAVRDALTRVPSSTVILGSTSTPFP